MRMVFIDYLQSSGTGSLKQDEWFVTELDPAVSGACACLSGRIKSPDP